MSQRRRLLLIGAGGFVGAHLADVAAGAGYELVATGRQPVGEVPSCDLLDPASVSACVAVVKPDLVLNAAGAASVGRSWERPAETFAVNATGVLHLLEAVTREAPAAHVLCISSADVYGVRDESELPLDERLEPRPVTPYGASKAAMEMLCGQYARSRGLRIGIARLFNLIGPGQSPRFAAPSFARRIVEAERAGEAQVDLALGNAAARRDFVDVRDGARALVELSGRELCGTYNLCSGEGRTIAQLVEELSGQARVPITLRREPGLERPADPPALVGDPRRLREATGFVPQIPLVQSLADLLDEWRARLASA
ncbi:MAG TPA: NAD-dependent epimerase/dehydratase family protein [Solirubrobacterales bacterium]|jgi:GDP-4-dehydro-6-deoxy-D-mannose reductase|nr:NAD-dependent epimerase/dehydratase family protein [Solirubrobacterales bacterium]